MKKALFAIALAASLASCSIHDKQVIKTFIQDELPCGENVKIVDIKKESSDFSFKQYRVMADFYGCRIHFLEGRKLYHFRVKDGAVIEYQSKGSNRWTKPQH